MNTESGYYIKFCTYTDKNEINNKQHNNKTIGIDFGCSTSFTTSEGKKYKIEIRETYKFKHLQKQLSNKQGFRKGEIKSNNFKRVICKLKKEFRHISNIKNDKTNKLVSEFCNNKTVVIQDEQLKKWHKTNPKAIQYSILGRVKDKLIKQSNVIVINKYAPTTKLCNKCGKIHDMPTNKRIFECNCGIKEDRDIHAAKNMVWMYNNKIGVGRTKLTHAELTKQIEQAIVFN